MDHMEMDCPAKLNPCMRPVFWDQQRESLKRIESLKLDKKKNNYEPLNRSFRSLQTTGVIFAQHIMPAALSGHLFKKKKNE